MGQKRFRHIKMLRFALLFGLLGGISGVLVDADHWLNTTGFEGWGLAGRPLHVPMAIGACLFGIYCYSRLRGLALGLVLKRILIGIGVLVLVVGVEIMWIWVMGDV